MLRIVLMVVFSIFCGTVHAYQNYTWFDKARDAYKERDVEMYGVIAVCESLAGTGRAAVLQRDRGRSYGSVTQDENIIRDWDHPVVDDLGDWHVRAISIAFDNPSYTVEVIDGVIRHKCISGEGEFESLIGTLVTTPLAPRPTEKEVLDFACPYYGRWVSNIAMARDSLGKPLWLTLERWTNTREMVVPYPIQERLIESVYRNHQHSGDELSEIVENACFNREGIFK